MSELNVQVEELSPVVRRLRIDVPAARVTQVTDAVYRRLGQQVKLPGFRPGHVPRRVLEKHFSDRVRNDVAREVMQSTFPEALGNVQLSPVAEPTIEPEEVRPGEDFHYTARIEIRPDVKLGEYKGLEVSVSEHTVSEADVDQQIERLREKMSTLVPIEGRDVAENGDYATVDFEVDIPGAKTDKRDGGLIQVQPGNFLEGNGEKLLGQKIGETRELQEVLSESAPADKRGKTAAIRVTLTGLKRSELPALDDEFAKDIRNLETFAELRADVRRTLEKGAEEESKTERRTALMRQLVDKNPLEVPPALVDSAAEQMARSVLQNLARRGLSLPGLEGLVDRMKAEAIPRATDDLKGAFLLDAVAKAENLDVTPEDVAEHFEKTAAEEEVPVEKVKARYRSPEAINGLKQTLRNVKAVALLESHAHVTVKPAEPAPAAPEAGEAPTVRTETVGTETAGGPADGGPTEGGAPA